MTLTNLTGFVPLCHDVFRMDGTTPGVNVNAIMDASTEKVAIVGCVWHPTVFSGTINIRKIHFRCGAVTFNVASALQVSIQNVSNSAGPPYQPDGTPDQTVSMTSLSANGINSTGNLSADRAVDLSADSIGDANSRWIAVVFEFTTFTAADSVVISGNNLASVPAGRNLGGAMLLNTGSWAALTSAGIIVLECDDGTFAFLEGCIPGMTFSNAVVSSTGAIRRAGFRFKFPVQVKINKLAMLVAIPNNCDGRFVLYDSDGTTELVSVDVDNDAVYDPSDISFCIIRFTPVTLTADTFYRFAFVGGTATAATVYHISVNAVGHMDGMMLGQNLYWTQHNGTAWDDTFTTRRPWSGYGVCAVHDGGGSSGGGGASVIRIPG